MDRALRYIIVFHSIIILYEQEIHTHQSPSLFLFGASERRNTGNQESECLSACPLSPVFPMRICASAYPPNLGFSFKGAGYSAVKPSKVERD